ncbi:MAG: hypothetical protein KF764_07925 [Labilithrix sp.]|nr:hypothetical protein [Labilithrix sp.]
MRAARARTTAWLVALGVALGCAATATSARAQDTPAREEPERPADKPGDTANGDEDIVEVLDDGPETPAGPAAKAAPEPAKSDKVELRGFARTTLQVGLPGEGSAPRVTNGARTPNEQQVGYERASSVNQAYLDVRYTRGKSFQAVLSGSLAYTASLMEGRAGERFDSREVRTVLLEPLLREAYLGFYSERVDVRLGQQRIVWGNSDAAAPNDVLNARDTRNRMQLDPEMVHIPTLAARADFDLGIAVLGVVAQPFFIPDRASIYGANWSLVQPDAPRHVRKFFGTYGGDRDPAEVDGALVRARAANQNALAGASIGTSLRFHFGSFDASYYYHYGRDRTPFVYLDPNVATAFDAAKSDSNPTGEDFEVIYGAQKKAAASYGGPFVVQYVRRHHVGTDLTTTAGPLVLRLDAAFDSAMTFYTKQNLNSVARPTAQAVLGAEYQRGFGKVIVVEASYMRLLGPEVPIVPAPNQANSGPLLFVRDDNLGVANVIRWTFFENVVVEARSFLGVRPLSWVLRPEVGWATPSFTARVGYLLIDGEGGSFGSYYRRNETVYLTTRYSF